MEGVNGAMMKTSSNDRGIEDVKEVDSYRDNEPDPKWSGVVIMHFCLKFLRETSHKWRCRWRNIRNLDILTNLDILVWSYKNLTNKRRVKTQSIGGGGWKSKEEGCNIKRIILVLNSCNINLTVVRLCFILNRCRVKTWLSCTHWPYG